MAGNRFVTRPYGVLVQYTDPDGVTREGKYAKVVQGKIPTLDELAMEDFLVVLKTAAANERSKEIAYISKLKNEIFNDNNGVQPIIYKDIQNILDKLANSHGGDVSQYECSQVFDILQKIKLGLYDVNKTLSANVNIFRQFNELTLNQSVMGPLKQIFGVNAKGKVTESINIHESGASIISSIISSIEKQVDEKLKSTNPNTDFTKRQKEILQKMTNSYKSHLEQFYAEKFPFIEKTELMSMELQDLNEKVLKYDKKIMKSKKGDARTIEQVVYDSFFGAMGGKSLEIVIDLSGGGVNTGNVLNRGKAIDADNILLASETLQYSAPKIPNKDENKEFDFEDLKKEIEDINEVERKFMLLFSDKDQSSNASFNDFVATNTSVKIKGSAALATRRYEIEEMMAVVGASAQAEQLIFGLANLTTDFVSQGNITSAKQALGALCIAWMFDDAAEIVQNKSMFPKTDSLHFYNINGWYYTLSDILTLTLGNVSRLGTKGNKSMKYVSISLTVADNPYEAMLKQKNQPEHGIAQWNYVSDALLANTKIGIYMNVKSLFSALFNYKK